MGHVKVPKRGRLNLDNEMRYFVLVPQVNVSYFSVCPINKHLSFFMAIFLNGHITVF